MISQPFNRFKKRDKPRRKRPELFFEAPEAAKVWRFRKPVRKVSAKQRGKWKTRKALRIRWWAEGNRTCGICGHEIVTFEEMTNDHIVPGSGKDDSEANLQPAHIICNLEKASIRNYVSPRRKSAEQKRQMSDM